MGRYEVLCHLASGGMAEVLLGRLVGPSGFERPVVIKRILPHLAREKGFVDMFLDEARIAASIRHPNVVHVTDLSDATGELYLVMEYLEGESLAAVLRRTSSRGERFESIAAAHVVAEACAGLHAAHELTSPQGQPLGIVHRDVSPQNVFVGYDGHAKILDFGIATAANRITHTETGQLKGKVEYMSPEQCEGLPLDRRSDVFALGVVLYEASTQRRLFKRDNKLQAMRAVVEGVIPPPSSVHPDYPKDLEAIVMKALARPLDQRFASAAEMRRELLAFLRAHAPAEGTVDERLAASMRGWFHERMEEKREILARVGGGSALTHFPTAEPDPGVELALVPETEIATTPLAAAAVTVVAPLPVESTRRPSGAPLAMAGVALVAAVALCGWALTRGASTSPPSTVVAIASPAVASPPSTVVAIAAHPPPSSAPSPSALPPPSVASPPITTTTLSIETTPSGATVAIDGVERGVAPLIVSLPRDATASARVLVSLAGREAVEQTVALGADQHLRLALPRARRRGPVATRPPPSSATPPPTETRPRFRRFD